MDRRWAELGDFLRSRRARLDPRDVLPGDRRQVPGLRREELASRAGVSLAYYIRLEQGRAPHVSDDVLRAVCRALGLDDTELEHVWRLARPRPVDGAGVPPEVVRPQLRTLLDALLPVPGLVLGRDRHVLAWNATAHALHAPHLERSLVDDPDARPWWPELLFCDPLVAERFADWDAKARDTVADLRGALARRPGDDRLAHLVTGLRARCPEFEALWHAYPVVACAFHDRTYRDPDVGEFELHDEFLGLGDDDGQRLALFTAEPGSPSADALARLAGAAQLGVRRPRSRA